MKFEDTIMPVPRQATARDAAALVRVASGHRRGGGRSRSSAGGIARLTRPRGGIPALPCRDHGIAPAHRARLAHLPLPHRVPDIQRAHRHVFNHPQYPTDLVVLVVLRRLRHKRSLRDLAEMFLAASRRCPSSAADPTDVTAYACFAPAEATLADLVRVAGSRWTVGICCEAAKQEVGLAEYEVRSWTGWHRHVTLACLAHAFLTALRAHGVDPLATGLKGGATTGSLARFKASRRTSSS